MGLTEVRLIELDILKMSFKILPHFQAVRNKLIILMMRILISLTGIS